MDDGATLDDLRESVTTLDEVDRTARRVFGSAHPLTTGIERQLQDARAVLRRGGRKRLAIFPVGPKLVPQ